MYDLIKSDAKKVSETFTPEQITLLKKLDELEETTYDSNANNLIKD